MSIDTDLDTFIDQRPPPPPPARRISRGPVLTLAAALALATVVGAYALWSHARSVPRPTVPAPALDAASVVATVDGKAITELEISGIEAAGVDRAIALDRTINKVLLEQMARKVYPQESALALDQSAREVLAQLYVTRRTAELTKRITSDDVRHFYDTNVKAEDYATYKVRYLVTQDPKAAEHLAVELQAGPAPELAAKFVPLSTTGDGFEKVQDLPYGLGQIVRGMKPGTYSGPLTLRSGLTFLGLDEIRPGVKPELAKVADQIKELVVAQRLSDELNRAHREAHIELH